MSDIAVEELARLRGFAKRRLANPNGQPLGHHLDSTRWEAAIADAPLAPWEMSLGYHTPFWATLDEEQRLALNHWTYVMMYFRIGDGERFVVLVNDAIADALVSYDPEVAALMRLESHEEVDHIAAFMRVLDAVRRRHQMASLRMPVKPLRPLIVSKPSVRFLIKTFGADFITTYFLGRGIVNHMGKAFETKVADLPFATPLTRLSMLHTVDENRHMAVSRMMAACTYQLLERRSSRNPLYAAMSEAMQRTTITYTFSDAITTGQERAMSHRAVPQMKALSRLPKETLREIIDAHFDGVTGLEHAKNEFMPKFNQRLLDRAGLSLEEKRVWFEMLVSLQRNLRFFPEGYQPGTSVDEAFDELPTN
ncbi:MAG: hypothetical protein Q8N23_24020 [Archangium sp.]|nr:hypothetical protein [Archangium sp.]MDP3155761.1 hypothetical protein [Archangium sp.]MDP3574003.1 hypothetical protein [Archangium sp.]